MKKTVLIDGVELDLRLSLTEHEYRLKVDDSDEHTVELHHVDGDKFRVRVGDKESELIVVSHGDNVYLKLNGRSHTAYIINAAEKAKMGALDNQDIFVAPMPGVVVEINVEKHDKVVKGDVLMLLESMKLFTPVIAWKDGIVEDLFQDTIGKSFPKAAPLIKLS